MYIYTDGGCRPNPGKGAAGHVIVSSDKTQEMGHDVVLYDDTTNNRMELQAAINALQWFFDVYYDKGIELTLITDSNYVKSGITDWINKWKTNGWKNAKGKPVENQDLWMKLDELVKYLKHDSNLQFQWVRGHGDDRWNKRVDQICTNALMETEQIATEVINKMNRQELSFTFEQMMKVSMKYAIHISELERENTEEEFKKWYANDFLRKN